MIGSEPIRTLQSASGEGESLVSSESPWPGLAPFTEEQSGLFHGRDEEIRALARLMERKALTVLFGQSGLGKSSLLQAGVFPRLRAAGFCPIYIRLDHGDGAPAPVEQVKAIVAAETARVGTWTKPGIAKPGESLWEFFHHRDDRLVDANGRTIVPVLVFDQFEELFTLGARSTSSGPAARSTGPSTGSGSRAESGDRGSRAESRDSGPADAGAQRDRAVGFMSELAELVENRPSEQLVARLEQSADEMDAFDFSRTDYRICISLREDYLPHLEGLKTIMPALMENRMRLTRMTGNQALDAVLKPGGALVTGEVARAIVEFVSGARGGSTERLAELDVEPPLLSVICRELNERRRALGQAQITADLVTGNRREILHDFYERSVADLPEPVRRFVEDKLLTKSGFRDNLALETALEEPGVTKPLIDTLVARRLLRIEDRIGTQRVELTHDVLADVVRASRDARQQRIALEQAQVRERAAASAAARRTRRMRLVIAGLAAAVVALLVGAVFGLRAQRRAEAAQREAAAQSSRTDFIFGSQLLEQDKTPEGLAYLVRAARSDPTNNVVGPRLISALVYRSFAAPLGKPIPEGQNVVGVAYTGDGHHAIAIAEDRILVWDLQTAKEERVIETGRLATWPVRSPDGRSIATSSFDGAVNVWNLETGQRELGPLPNDGAGPGLIAIGGIAFSPDGRWLVTSTFGPLAKVWNRATGKLVAALPHATGVAIAVISPDSTRLATAEMRGSVHMWRLPDGQPLARIAPSQFVGGSGHATALRFSPDSTLLAVADDRGAQLFDSATGSLVGTRMPHVSPVYGLAFTHDGERLVTASVDGTVGVWLVPSGRAAFDPLHHGGAVGELRITPDDRLLVTRSADGVAHVWNLATGTPALEPIRIGDVRHDDLSPDGRELLTFGREGMMRRWSIIPGAAMPFPLGATLGNAVGARVIAGSTMLWVAFPNRLQKIEALTGQPVGDSIAFPATVTAADIAPDARHLRVEIGGTNSELWAIGGASVVRHPLGRLGSQRLRAFSHDSSRFLFDDSRDTMRLWDTDTGAAIGEPIEHASKYAAFSPDDRLLVYSTGNGAVVIDARTGARIDPLLAAGSSLYGVAFSPDGRLVVTCDAADGIARLWDAKTHQPFGPPLRHRLFVRAAAFSPDSKRLVTFTPQEARTWDVATGQPLSDPIPGGPDLFQAAFNGDGTRVATLSRANGEIRLWGSTTGQLLGEPFRILVDRNRAGLVIQNFMNAANPNAFGFSFLPVAGYLSSSPGLIWSLPPQSGHKPVPGWLLRLATAVAGGEIGSRGNFHEQAFDANTFDSIRRELAALPDDAPYVEWGRWFLADRATRSIAPGFTITPAEAAKLAEETEPAAATP